jgi:cytoskeleton protein RodZ
MSDSVLGDTVADMPPRVAGSSLRAARESAGMSIEEVATKLKLSSRQVAAIEAEDWARLPERTFTRGFFYSYARLVGVDKKLIDSSFAARSSALGEMRTLPAGKNEVTIENTSVSPMLARWLIPLGLLALLVAGIGWYVWRDFPLLQVPATTSAEPSKKAETSKQPSPSSPDSIGGSGTQSSVPLPNQTASPAQLNQAIIGGAGVNPSSTVPTDTSTPGATVPNAPTGAAAPTATATTVTTPATAPPVTPPTTAPAATTPPPATSGVLLTAGQRKVTLAASGRSWIEVRSRGEVVLSEMLSSGNRELSMSAPISFVIGNASNVKLTVDNQPYDFSMHVRNEVARFRVE